MKNMIKLPIIALSLCVALSAARAQNTTNPSPPIPPGEQEIQHGPRGGRLEMLSEKLGLTADQKSKISPILDDERQSLRALHHNSALDKDAKRAKMEEIQKTHREQIRAVLTPEQQKKFDELKEERRHKPEAPTAPTAPSVPKTPSP